MALSTTPTLTSAGAGLPAASVVTIETVAGSPGWYDGRSPLTAIFSVRRVSSIVSGWLLERYCLPLIPHTDTVTPGAYCASTGMSTLVVRFGSGTVQARYS